MRSYKSSGIAVTTDLVNYAAVLSQNTNSANIELMGNIINDGHRYLLEKYFFNENSKTMSTVSQQQFYNLPYNYSLGKTFTITVGTLTWTPTEIFTREDWDRLNVFPYYSDIPKNFFVYNGQVGIWPIPSTGSTQLTYSGLTGTLTIGDIVTAGSATGKILTFTGTVMVVAVTSTTVFSTGSFTTSAGATGTIASLIVTPGNTLTFNYKIRVPDLSFTDYSTGTVTVTNGSTTITGATTGFLANYLPLAGSVLNLNLWIKVPAPNGDGNWYQISSIESATSLTLKSPYNGSTKAGATYVIGQMPLLLEDYHNLLVYYALVVYFNSINHDAEKLAEFKEKYDDGIKMMDSYANRKTIQVNLRQQIELKNPNSYPQSIG